MRYLGGKTRIAKQLAAVIDQHRRPGQLAWDAFCGGLSMSVALSKNGPVCSTDANAALINLYLSVQRGWIAPDDVTEEIYQSARALPDTDPMKAFCGFGMSFGGKWFGGRAKLTPGKFAPGVSRRSLERTTRGLEIRHMDFMLEAPGPVDAILYLDPPYSGTQAYPGMPAFDSDLFWERARAWAQFTTVFVSEYTSDWPEVWSRDVTCNLSGGTGAKRTERLFMLSKGVA